LDKGNPSQINSSCEACQVANHATAQSNYAIITIKVNFIKKTKRFLS
jgi:hypothetical protein